MSEDIYDVVIIGGGPGGLAAAQYASRAKLKTVVIDKSSTAGALAFTDKIENYPGFPEPIAGVELLKNFRDQATRFGAEYYDDKQVIGVSLEGDVKEVFTMEESYKGKTVIIATGSMGRKATIEGEAEFLGHGVSYCAICDANFFRGKIVCVIGNSEEAAKEAGLLCKFAEKVYLISPTKELKVESDHHAFDHENLEVLKGHMVKKIRGDEIVEGVEMITDEGEKFLELHGVFVYMQGSQPIVDFLNGVLEASDNGCLVADKDMMTSIAGVYAVGDVRCVEVRQVALAAADGCLAALSAEQFINKRNKKKSDWVKTKE
ncbi:NAD(P)/FAD-dependent oxidoreductase [Nitrospirota bacterium]